jgi:hypothetical protein
MGNKESGGSMKTLITSLAIILMACTMAMAEGEPEGEAFDKDTFCTQIEHLAEKIMEARQKGVPMANMYKIFDDEFGREMVIEAYEYQRYNSREIQDKMILDYKNHWFMICLKAI